MASTITLSDEYGWTASFGLFDMVLRFLLERVAEPRTRQELETVLNLHIGGIDVQQQPTAGRDEIMRALRDDLVDFAESSSEIVQDQPTRRLAIGHLKVLKLMADDIARSQAAGSSVREVD